MKKELVFLRAFDHLTGKRFGVSAVADNLNIVSEFKGEQVTITYTLYGETQYYCGKNRRIFILAGIKKNEQINK